MARLRRLPPMSQAKLVQIGEDQGSNVVVTPAPPHLHLLEWLAAEERPAEPEPGEFTRLFQSPPRAPVNEPPPAKSAEPAPPKSAEPLSPRSGEPPGEFTRMFQTSASKPPERATEPPPASREPGEFTRLFQSPALAPKEAERRESAPPKEPERRESSPASAPGEFTRFFRGSQPEIAPSPSFPPPSPLAAAPGPPAAPAPGPPAEKGGEFTRIFGRPGAEPRVPPPVEVPPSAPPPPAAPVSQPQGPSEYTQMIGRPRNIQTPPPPQVSVPVPSAPATPQMSAPSIPQVSAPVMPQVSAPARPQPPTAVAPQSNWLMMAIVGIVCFLAGGLLVFLLMKR